MFPMNEQITNTTKANLESQLSMWTAWTTKAFESVEKIVDLNLNTAKASIEDSAVTARQLLAAKDPQEFLSLTTAHAQPTAAKAIAYGRNLVGIASIAQAELARAAEEQIAETGRKVSALVDDVSKNAPAGSENVIAIMKSAIGNANASYEQLTKTTKHAVEVMEANLNSAANHFSQAAEQASSASRTRSK